MKYLNKVPKLRFPEFSEEWEEKKLGKIVSFSKGKGIPKSALSNSGTKCILYGQLYTTYHEIIEDVTSYTDIDEKELLFGEIGDVLIPSSGETALDMSLASALLVKNVALGGDINILRPKKGSINSKFLSYQINSARKIDLAKIAEGASVVHLYNSNLKSIDVISPTNIKEQEKIADFFTLIDEKIKKQEGKIANLEEYKKGIMQKIFSQEIRFKDGNGGDYPEWEKKKVKEIFGLTRGVVIAKDTISDVKNENNQYPVFSSQTTNNGILGWDNSYDFEGNYLTWTTDGANAGKVFYRSGKFRCTNVCGVLVEKINTKGYANKLIAELLEKETPRYVSYVGNPKLMNNVMSEVSIDIPSLPEQRKIANFLFAIDLKIEKEKEKLGSLKELKKGFMQKMFI